MEEEKLKFPLRNSNFLLAGLQPRLLLVIFRYFFLNFGFSDN